MNIDELTKYLKHFNKSHIYQMVHREEIPYENLGKELKFDKKKIDEWNKKRLIKLEKDKGFITLKEVCHLIGVKKATVYQWKCHGKIPSHKRGKFLMFNLEEIKAWDKANRPQNF